jgi:hypothetical protein
MVIAAKGAPSAMLGKAAKAILFPWHSCENLHSLSRGGRDGLSRWLLGHFTFGFVPKSRKHKKQFEAVSLLT